MSSEISSHPGRLALQYDAPGHRRVIAGKDVILHCHHYNARLQRTIESADIVDGKRLLVAAAERVFAEHVGLALKTDDSPADRVALAEALYARLGFGRLDLSRHAEGVVVGRSSHFVEGWLAALGRPERMVCSFTEGYVQGALFAIGGELVHACEVECMALGAPACRFELVRGRSEPVARNSKRPVAFTPQQGGGGLQSPNVDAQAIVDAFVAMPIEGGEDGLIPAFGVYFACMPADFYNRVCIDFVAAMRRVGRGTAAAHLLIGEAENCAMHGLRSLMSSPEWDGLIAPMLREPADVLFAVIAVNNALGWGEWRLHDFTPGESMTLESLNGYEAIGLLEYGAATSEPQCYAVTGAAAGILAILHGEGPLSDRFGMFRAVEQRCVGCDAPSCLVHVERVR